MVVHTRLQKRDPNFWLNRCFSITARYTKLHKRSRQIPFMKHYSAFLIHMIPIQAYHQHRKLYRTVCSILKRVSAESQGKCSLSAYYELKEMFSKQ